jgi:hypothetical protein
LADALQCFAERRAEDDEVPQRHATVSDRWATEADQEIADTLQGETSRDFSRNIGCVRGFEKVAPCESG